MKQCVQTLLISLVCAALLLSGCSKVPQPNTQPPAKAASISAQEISMSDAVQAWRSKNAIFLDVRTPEEYRQGHIPGAVLIPLSELEKRHAEIPKDKTVLIICRSGNRSAQANLILQKFGFGNTRSIQGGMLDWPERVEK